MTLKIILATVLQLSICWAHDKLVEWETPPSSQFKLVEQTDHHDQTIIGTFCKIASDYHWKQFQNQKIDQRPMTEEAYQNVLHEYRTKISDDFQSGKLSLLIVYNHDQIVAGTFYGIEENQQTIRIYLTALHSDLKHMDKSIIIQTLVRVLSDPTKFPQASRLVAIFRSYNNDGYVLKRLGFVDSTYQNPEFNRADYIVLEKPIYHKK